MNECPSVECCDPVYGYSADTTCIAMLDLILVPYPPEGGGTVGSGKYPIGTDVIIQAVANETLPEDVGVDMVIVVDESGSMDAAWAYIPTLIQNLDSQLRASGIGSGVIHNRYGLVGQGIIKGPSSPCTPMTAIRGEGFDYYMGGTNLWTDIDPADPSPGLNKILVASLLFGTDDVSGGRAFEDSYAGIHRAIQGRVWRDGVAKIIVFFTDEDRNYPTYVSETVLQDYGAYTDTDWAAQRANMTAEIAKWGGTVHGAANVRMADSTDPIILGQESAISGKTYKADGSGGFTTGTVGRAVGEDGTNTGWDGDSAFKLSSGSIQDYYQMLVAIPFCTVWDYVKFYIAGPTGTSFTTALVSSLHANIVSQLTWVFDGWTYTDGTPFPNSMVNPQTIKLNARTVLRANFHKQ